MLSILYGILISSSIGSGKGIEREQNWFASTLQISIAYIYVIETIAEWSAGSGACNEPA